MSAPNYNEQSARDNPGTTYRRTRYIGIRNNPTGPALVEILEADALFINGVKEHLREGVGGLNESIDTTDPAALARSFPLRNPATDAVIPGQTATVGQALAIIYAYARDQQVLRDAKEVGGMGLGPA